MLINNETAEYIKRLLPLDDESKIKHTCEDCDRTFDSPLDAERDHGVVMTKDGGPWSIIIACEGYFQFPEYRDGPVWED